MNTTAASNPSPIPTPPPTPAAPHTAQGPAKPAKPMALIVPTGRFYGLLCLGFLIPMVLSWLPRYGLVAGFTWMLGYNVLLWVLLFLDFYHSRHWQLDISRHCEPRLSIGRDNLIQLKVTTTVTAAKPKQHRQILLQLREHTPAEFRCDRPDLAATLVPDSETELSYHVFPPRRGKFSWQKLDCRLLGQRGLAWRTWSQPLKTEIEVYPDLMGLRELSVRLSLESTGSLRRRRHALGGNEFSELREYSLGDDLRLLDWKATARRGQPLVRLMEPERDQPLIILLDRGRLMTAKVAGLKRFDWALNATLSLALAGLRRGDRVGVCVFDNEIQTWIAPQAGQSHLSRILEQVYNQEPVLLESDYVGTVSTLLNRYPRRALVVLLTDLVDRTASAELLAAMGQLSPRYLPFCVALRDPQVDAMASQALQDPSVSPVNTSPVNNSDKMSTGEQLQQLYEQSVCLDLIQQRQVAFAQVKQKGVLVLDAPANKISELLVDRYLLLKARGRL